MHEYFFKNKKQRRGIMKCREQALYNTLAAKAVIPLCLFMVMCFLSSCTVSSSGAGSTPARSGDSSGVQSATENLSGSEGEVPADTSHADGGFSLTVDADEGLVVISPDADAGEIIAALGEDYTYYEAPSCAFRGIDKIYTYNDFEIHTYPDGDIDRVYLIYFLSDLVSAPGGVCVGMPLDGLISACGEPDSMNGQEYIYMRADSALGAIVEDGVVTAVTVYSLKALD